MPPINGTTDIQYALKKNANSWNGVPAVCGAGSGILCQPIASVGEAPNEVADYQGTAYNSDTDPGPIKASLSLPNIYPLYNDAVIWMALATLLGTAGAPATHAAGTLSKDHILKTAGKTDGLHLVFAALLGTNLVEELPFWKIDRAVFKWAAGKPLTLTLSGPASNLVTDSATNTSTTFANVTILERKNRMYFAQTVFRINAQTGGALAGGDAVKPTEVTLTFQRKLKADYTGATYTVSGGPARDIIDEPINDGPLDISIQYVYPRTADLSGRADQYGAVAKKADITMTGPIIEGAIPYLATWQMPNLVPKSYENPHARGALPNTREYSVLGCDTAPTGMTGITVPLWLLLTNKVATDLLA
jgi:hypothetical protein